MKKRTQQLVVLGMSLLLFNFTVTAQGSSEILNTIENSENYDTFELAHMDKDISTFINLVALSGLESSLLMLESHTAFIPTNDAFKQMNVDEYLHLTNPKNKADLTRFVKYHFLPEKVSIDEFKDTQIIDAKGWDDISITVDEDYQTVYVGGARIIKENIETENGIIHIVDRVITPFGGLDLSK
jgi:uncharacterized surface protein with fasciclin (FAS1) repeats